MENRTKLDIKYFFRLTAFLSPVFGNDIFVFLTIRGENKILTIKEFVDYYSENGLFKDDFYD
jgi:hypothetical protein